MSENHGLRLEAEALPRGTEAEGLPRDTGELDRAAGPVMTVPGG